MRIQTHNTHTNIYTLWVELRVWLLSVVLMCLTCGPVKKGDKGVDLVASLCNNYDTSEDDLRKSMEKTNNIIANILKKKPLLASECKTENLENIDTGWFDEFSIYF